MFTDSESVYIMTYLSSPEAKLGSNHRTRVESDGLEYFQGQ